MSVFDEPKIDCHAHVLDPGRFPYAADVAYHPVGPEAGTADQFIETMPCYGIAHALLVQPNSGYGGDNRCLLDALARYPDRFRGVAIVPMDATLDALADLKAQGVVGVAFNPTLYGAGHYAEAGPLLGRLAELDMILSLQVRGDLLLAFLPRLRESGVRVLIDHCGQPDPARGLSQPGFAALLGLAESGRAWVKLSGYAKFAGRLPFEAARPYVRALAETFTLDRCLWASDWPYLRAPDRQDLGPLLHLVPRLFPDAADRRKLFWDTPAALLGFDGD